MDIVRYKVINSSYEMDKLNLKNSLYCGARYLSWKLLFGLVIGLFVLLIFHFLLTVPTIIVFFAALTAEVFATKFSLEKVFFKPYKNFAITPTIENIPFSIALTVTLATNLLNSILISSLFLIFKWSVFNITLNIVLIFIRCTIDIFAIKYVIEKYSNIIKKGNRIITEIIH